MTSDTTDRRLRRLCFALVACTLVLLSGCSALGGGGPAETTTNGTTQVRTTDGGTTTVPTDTTAETTSATTTGTDDGNATRPNSENVSYGQIALAVRGDRVDLQERIGTTPGEFWMDENTSDVWHATGPLTVSEALSEGNVSLTEGSLTIDGRTYSEDTAGTDISVRVNGEEVDPETFDFNGYDEVWVVVETDSMDASVPGQYIDDDSLHMHGAMNVTVNGDRVNFTRSRYQGQDRYFHFEGGDAEWHAHSTTASLAYALGTLPGMNATEDTVTVGNETYSATDPGTELTVEVNGEAVDPTSYYLKDGDSVRVVVSTSD